MSSAAPYSGISTEARTGATFALLYAPGPRWLPGRPIEEQDLGMHRDYMRQLYDLGRVLLGGPFLDHAGGGIAILRADSRQEANEVLAEDPAIVSTVLKGEVRRWHATFDRAQQLQKELAEARVNAHAIRRLFDAVDHRDRAGVAAAYDENIVIHEAPSLPYGGDYGGHDGALRHGQGFRAAWDQFQQNDLRGLEPRIIAHGDHVAVLWRHKAENFETGDRIDLPAVSIYRMRAGKIIDSRMFHFDTAALLHFLQRNTPR